MADIDPGLLLAALLGAALTLIPLWLLQRRSSAEAVARGRAEREPEISALQAELESSQQQSQERLLRLDKAEQQLQQLRERLDLAHDERAAARVEAARVADLEHRLSRLQDELSGERSAHGSIRARLAEVLARSEEQQRGADEKLVLLGQAEQRLRESFQTLAQQILEERAQRFGEQSQQQIGGLIEPLREQLREFRESVIATHAAEQKERGVLSAEIQTLKQLNQRISEDAINLTRALKGDSQTQGAWGELVLERLLEASGLQAGREYEAQTSFADGEGGRARPDIVVRLPDDKDLVIDSKVSLTAYERSVAANDELARESALREHVGSLRRHMDGLAARNYASLPGLRTLDLVLMFVPVEAAFIEAVRRDETLYLYALERGIALVSPSTLLATLRTVNHLWKIERRNLNAMEIAQRAARLHDNFVALVGELETVGQQLDRAQKAQSAALRRLTEGGKGSVLLQVQSLTELGAPSRKKLPEGLLRQAGADDADGATDEG